MKNLPTQTIRWYGWRPDKPDPRDKRVLPKAARNPSFAAIPIGLLPPIRNQGDLGSCTGHATRTALQIIRAKSKQEKPYDLSPLFLYYQARFIEGAVKEDAGAEIRDVIKGAHKAGAASEKDWPYRVKDFAKKPSAKAIKNAHQDVLSEYLRVPQTLSALKSCIVRGEPIVFGFSVFDQFEGDECARDGLLRMPQPSWKMDGGHAVCAIAYDDEMQVYDQKGAFLIANSWGGDWGCTSVGTELESDKGRGYFWMPYRYITDNDLADDFWLVRAVT